MTFAPVHIDGPAEDTRRAYGATLNALRGAVARSADLLRRIDDPDAPAPGLSWTARKPRHMSSATFVTTPRR